MKELEGAYIATRHLETKYGTRTEIRILNPSLEDYLVYFYSVEAIDEYFDVLESAAYIDQIGGRVTTRKELKKINIGGNQLKILWNLIISNIDNYLTIAGSKNWQQLHLLTSLFDWNETKSFVLPFVLNFEAEAVSWSDYDAILHIFKYLQNNGRSSDVESAIDRYLVLLAESIQSHYQINQYLHLIEGNSIFEDHLYQMKHLSPILAGRLQNAIDEGWRKSFATFIDHNGSIRTIFDERELRNTIERLTVEAETINGNLGFGPSPIFSNYEIDFKAQIKSNLKNAKKKKDILKIIPDNPINSHGSINELFNSNGPDLSLEGAPF